MQRLKDRWTKLLVYDNDQQTVEVKDEKDIGQSRAPSVITTPKLTRALSSDMEHCWKFDLPPPKYREVTLFVDHETLSRPTMAHIAADGRLNTILTTLHLYRLGVYPRVLRSLGLLSILCVVKRPSRETSPQVIDSEHAVGARDSTSPLLLIDSCTHRTR